MRIASHRTCPPRSSWLHWAWRLVRRRRPAPAEERHDRSRLRPAELEQALGGDRPPVLIDIRGRKAFEAGHLPGAVHMLLAELASAAARLDRSAPTVVY
jgi:hydroxyacylglutathione hydrolase